MQPNIVEIIKTLNPEQFHGRNQITSDYLLGYILPIQYLLCGVAKPQKDQYTYFGEVLRGFHMLAEKPHPGQQDFVEGIRDSIKHFSGHFEVTL